MNSRSIPDESNKYRYGFNGKENDDDGEWGKNSTNIDFGDRNYDPAIGRFKSVDAYAQIMPGISPYAYALNNPIVILDQDGNWPEPSKMLADMGMDLPPLAAGVLDGVWDGLSGTFGMAWDLSTKPEFRQQMFDAFAMIASDPMGTIGAIASDYQGMIQRVLSGNATDEDIYNLGKEVSSAITGYFTGGNAAKLMNKLKDVSKFRKGKVVRNVPCPRCFTGDTEVWTESGLIPISEIKQGDKVLAWDEYSDSIAYKEVIATISLTRDTIYSIFVGDEVIQASSTHPFYVDGEWIEVGDLKQGDILSLYDRSILAIDSIFIELKQHTVYNLSVADFETYFVSELGILVHNCGKVVGRDGEYVILNDGKKVKRQIHAKNKNDIDFKTIQAARREAMRRAGIVTSKPFKTEIKIDPESPEFRIEIIYDASSGKKIGELSRHQNGHYFDDKGTGELPHYHDKNGAHITHEKNQTRGTNTNSGKNEKNGYDFE